MQTWCEMTPAERKEANLEILAIYQELAIAARRIATWSNK